MRFGRRWRWLLPGIVPVIVSLLLGTHGVQAQGEALVHLYYFFDPFCHSCAAVHADTIAPLQETYGEQLVVHERNIQESEHLELLLALEIQYEVFGGEIPEVFIGDEALVGEDEIRAHLRELIEQHLAAGGVALPEPAGLSPIPAATPAADAPPIHVAYFYQAGCDVCDRAERDLAYIVERHPQVLVRRIDVREEPLLNQYLCERAGVPEQKHLTAPMLFVGTDYLWGDAIRAPAIEQLITPLLTTGGAEPWEGFAAAREQAESSIIERFRSFGILTVIGAGLIDGVNPCAFATMIFLVSYLSVRKRTGKHILWTGAAFTTGVFVTYLAVGLGMLTFLTRLPFLEQIGRWIYGLTAILCLVLAYGSLRDYTKARDGRLEEMSLKLPKNLQNVSKKLIRRGMSSKRFVWSSLVLGVVVSLVELACTGQVYLPTIIFVLGMPEWRRRAVLALGLYNLMFVLPLIVVFLLVYWGTTSQQLVAWLNRRAATVKLAMAALFLLLAGWLIFSLVTL